MEFKILLDNNADVVEFIKVFRGAKLVKLAVLGQFREYKVNLCLETLKNRLAKLGNTYSMLENEVIIRGY